MPSLILTFNLTCFPLLPTSRPTPLSLLLFSFFSFYKPCLSFGQSLLKYFLLSPLTLLHLPTSISPLLHSNSPHTPSLPSPISPSYSHSPDFDGASRGPGGECEGGRLCRPGVPGGWQAPSACALVARRQGPAYAHGWVGSGDTQRAPPADQRHPWPDGFLSLPNGALQWPQHQATPGAGAAQRAMWVVKYYISHEASVYWALNIIVFVLLTYMGCRLLVQPSSNTLNEWIE